jgi:hypothetical protein
MSGWIFHVFVEVAAGGEEKVDEKIQDSGDIRGALKEKQTKVSRRWERFKGIKRSFKVENITWRRLVK